MTSLASFLATGIPPYETAKQYALILNDQCYAALQAAGAQRQDAQHRASAIQLTDGTHMLCADLLTEIGNGGLYAEGFALLDPALFNLVEVVPMDNALALLPTDEPLLVRARDELGRFIADNPLTLDVDEAWQPATAPS